MIKIMDQVKEMEITEIHPTQKTKKVDKKDRHHKVLNLILHHLVMIKIS